MKLTFVSLMFNIQLLGPLYPCQDLPHKHIQTYIHTHTHTHTNHKRKEQSKIKQKVHKQQKHFSSIFKAIGKAKIPFYQKFRC